MKKFVAVLSDGDMKIGIAQVNDRTSLPLVEGEGCVLQSSCESTFE